MSPTYLLSGLELTDDLKLHFFGDESHDSRREHVMTMAGFLAPRVNWNRLWVRWRDALAAEGVNVFHATECEGRQGEFGGWSRDRVEGLQRTLIDIVCDQMHDVIGFSCSVDLAAYKEFTPRLRAILKFPKGFSISGPVYDPYFILYQMLIEMVSTVDFIAELPNEEGIGFTFDQHHLRTRAKAIAEVMNRIRDFGYRVRRAGFMDKREIVPLQVADLIAYETYRYQAETRLGASPERWQYAALRARIRTARFMGRAEIERLVDWNEKRIREAHQRMRERDEAKRHTTRPDRDSKTQG